MNRAEHVAIKEFLGFGSEQFLVLFEKMFLLVMGLGVWHHEQQKVGEAWQHHSGSHGVA